MSEYLTASLLQSVQDIMRRAEAEGRDPDEELRQVVGRTVLEGVVAGYGMSETAADAQEDRRGDRTRASGEANGAGGDGAKRRRLDGEGPGPGGV